MTCLAESKLGSFWTTLLDAKKQLFVSEKFLNLASEEGTCSLLIFVYIIEKGTIKSLNILLKIPKKSILCLHDYFF